MKTLKPLKAYKHRSCLDMCIFVQRVYANGTYKVKYCDDRGFLYHEDSEIIYISEKELPNWREVKIS